MKIVLNGCHGGWSVSKAVYYELGLEWDGYGDLYNEDLDIESEDDMVYRADPRLIAAIEKIGIEKASGECSKLYIVEIDPPTIESMIKDYDGHETLRY